MLKSFFSTLSHSQRLDKLLSAPSILCPTKMFSGTVDETYHEELNMSVFSENNTVVTEPPTITREQEHAQGTRRLIPVSTIDWQSVNTSHFAPLQGLDFLHDVTQLIIQQTVELSGVMSTLESENRYTIKVPRGETIFYATETSTSFQRFCFGSSRAFSLRIYDASKQEAIQFKRSLACGTCCSIFPYLQELEVWIPPGDFIGRVSQKLSMARPSFAVYNHHNDVIYKIEGPDATCGCLLSKNHNFQIFSADGSTQIGSIINQWDQVQADYNLYLQMPGHETSSKNKALLLGAAFLLVISGV